MEQSTKVSLLDLSYDELKELVVSLGAPDYRAAQILQWVYRKFACSFEEMTDLPKPFREKLAETATLGTLKPLDERVSGDGQTRKMLFETSDRRTVETGLMLYAASDSGRERRTVCVSTQVGCPIGCPFCATGRQGFERDLRPGEILEQVLHFARFAGKEPDAGTGDGARRPVTNVVFMGMGEPLLNYDAVLKAIRMLNSKQGLGLGARQMTLSTAGIVPLIDRLARDKAPVELAFSLHAADDELRDVLVPLNRKYPLKELIAACRAHASLTGRRPTFEYALFRGVNDSPEQAGQLASLLSGMDCLVNLIAGNRTGAAGYVSSPREAVLAFEAALRGFGVNVTVRVSRGADIDAGCGQLRSRHLEVL